MAVKVAAWPNADGFGVEETLVVVAVLGKTQGCLP